MNSSETCFRSGCWRLVMLSSVLVLCLIPLCANGNTLEANVTETDNKVNSSSLSTVEGEQESAAAGFTNPSALPLQVGRRPRGWEELGSGTMGGGVAISPDSAEKDHLLRVSLLGTASSLPTLPSFRDPADPLLDYKGEEHTDPPYIWQGANGVLDLDSQPRPQSPSPPASLPVPSHPDVLTVDFFDPASNSRELGLSSPQPGSRELQGADPTSWTLSDFYDYLNPEDSYSTTEVYSDEDLVVTTEMDDDNVRLLTTTPAFVPYDPRTPSPFGPDDVLPSGAEEDENPAAAPGVVETTNGSTCRPGYVRHNATCRSPCDLLPGYCFNGGQCYLVEGIGAFCRCNVQDYIWHKGSRCQAVVTEFQVLCMAVAAAALTVLLLLLITVFFAKKLHRLKTENSRLRKRSSKYRPASEQHNDNFSLSTIAEGSHPNKTMSRYTWEYKTKEEPDFEDDPNAPNKLEDPVKAPPPDEDEPLNIHNSLTPKHENNKAVGEENSSEGGVTIDLELLLPKEAKMRPPSSPPLHYNVYLYKVPKSPELSRARGWETRPNNPQASPHRGYSPVSTRSLPPQLTKRPPSRVGKPYTP